MGSQVLSNVTETNISDANPSGLSGQERCDNLAANVGQPEVAPEMAVRQPLVVQAEAVEDGGLQIVDMHAILHNLQAEFVRLADDLSAFDATACHP
jgi:hypothetical protein